MPKCFLITGATGLLGTNLLAKLLSYNHKIYLISTKPAMAHEKFTDAVRVVGWDNYLFLAEEKIDIIINLAGRNVGEKRWNDKFKKEIYESRILSTKKIIELINKMRNKPEALINASGVDYYGSRGNENIYEDAVPGNDFMAKVCVDWEAEARKAEEFGVRVVLMRTGFVIAKDAEAVKRLVLPFRLFAGGTIGSGAQYISWIHIDDMIGIYIFAAENLDVTGPVNAAAPHPEQMKIFCRNLAKVLKRPAIFPIPSFAVKIVAGEVGDLILSGRKALPKKIMESGYKFKFEYSIDAWQDALN